MYTNYAMRFKGGWRYISFISVFQQRPNIALVVNLDGLLRRRRVVFGRTRLEYQAVDCGEYEKLAHQGRHLNSNLLRVL